MVARAEDIFLFESNRREKRLKEEEEFNHSFVKRNRAYTRVIHMKMLESLLPQLFSKL